MKKPHEPKYSTLACELAGAVRTITLNRPDRRNAISGDMIEDLLAALANAEADHAVRVVILTGAGKSFCSGMDLENLKTLTGRSPEQSLKDSETMARRIRWVRRLWKNSAKL